MESLFDKIKEQIEEHGHETKDITAVIFESRHFRTVSFWERFDGWSPAHGPLKLHQLGTPLGYNITVSGRNFTIYIPKETGEPLYINLDAPEIEYTPKYLLPHDFEGEIPGPEYEDLYRYHKILREGTPLPFSTEGDDITMKQKRELNWWYWHVNNSRDGVWKMELDVASEGDVFWYQEADLSPCMSGRPRYQPIKHIVHKIDGTNVLLDEEGNELKYTRFKDIIYRDEFREYFQN